MSEELLEALEIFKVNSQELELLKEQVSSIAQDILDIKIENRDNTELRTRVDQLSNDLDGLKEQIEVTNSLGGKVDIVSNDLSQVANELRINEGRLSEISQKYLDSKTQDLKIFLENPGDNLFKNG